MSVMARELHVPVNADVEQRGELPMEMTSGGRRDAAQHLDAQIVPETLLDVPAHFLQSSTMGPAG